MTCEKLIRGSIFRDSKSRPSIIRGEKGKGYIEGREDVFPLGGRWILKKTASSRANWVA